MAKRFTDTKKWQPWFRKLSAIEKVFWIYLCDSCDSCGVWEYDPEQAQFNVSPKLDIEKSLKAFNADKERIRVLQKGKKWLLVDFIRFQYAVLRPGNKVHAPIYRDLRKHGLSHEVYESSSFKDYPEALEESLDSLKEEVKEQDKEKDKVLEVGKKPFGEEGLVLLTQEEHEKLLVKLGERKTAEYVQRLENYIGSKGKKYKSHYHTILSWTANPKSGESAMNLNPKQQKNMEALRDFTERKGPVRPENLRAGDGHAVISLPGDKF